MLKFTQTIPKTFFRGSESDIILLSKYTRGAIENNIFLKTFSKKRDIGHSLQHTFSIYIDFDSVRKKESQRNRWRLLQTAGIKLKHSGNKKIIIRDHFWLNLIFSIFWSFLFNFLYVSSWNRPFQGQYSHPKKLKHTQKIVKTFLAAQRAIFWYIWSIPAEICNIISL